MSAGTLRFEDFELDRGAFQLRCAGAVVPLEGIPLELLFLLAERRGQLVTREEIVERIWGKDVFLDIDNGINTAVRKIRKALKDNPANPRLLHTVPGRGYRFTAQIVELEPPAEEAREARTPSGRKFWQRLTWQGLAALAVVAGFIVGSHLLKTRRASSGKIMLVVLPFEDMSGSQEPEYFADGMTEEIITQLGGLDPNRLGVIARTTAMQYKNTRKDTAQIARELGVNYLLEGSIRRANDRVRVTAQLIQASDQTHLWAGSFDRDLSDILKLQADVASAVAGKIQLTLSEESKSRLANASTVNAEAYEAYLQGLQAWNLRTKDGFERAIPNFNRAVAIDPDFALGWSGLARTYMLAPIFRVSQAAESMQRARDAAGRALRINESLAEAHTALAFVRAHFDYDWPGAEREYLRAIELNTSDAYSHFFYSNSYLSPLGRHEEAIDQMKKALALDPLSLPIQSFLGRTYLWAGRYDEAETQFRKAGQLNANFALNHQRLAYLLALRGKYEAAIDEEMRGRILAGQDPKSAVAEAEELRRTYAAAGARGYWLKVLEFSRTQQDLPEGYSSSFRTAIVLARLGEKEKSIDSLEKAFAEHSMFMTEINIEPAFADLKSSSRFSDLLRRVHLL
jgi:TolB-like protein/DNA-binding winged helix-turn-helix (wHTH) protein